MFRLSRTFIAPLLLLFSASLFAAAETKPAAPADLDLVLFWIKAVPCPVLNRTPSVVITPFLPKTVKRRQYLRHHRFIQPRKQYAA